MPADAFEGSKSLLREFEEKLEISFATKETPVHTNGTTAPSLA
jgi:hypothetical protein